MSLVRNASFLIVKNSGAREEVSDVNKSLCKNIFWWVRACATHLWFVHLPNWHFSLHLPPLQRPGMFAVYNFERLRFCSLPTSSHESVKHKSTFMFKFTLRTIYEVNYTATWVLGVVFFNHFFSHLPSFPSHIPHPYLSLFLFKVPWTPSLLVFRSFDQSIHRWIDPLIHPSIHTSFNRSIHW